MKQTPENKLEHSLLRIIGWGTATLLVVIVAGVLGYGQFRDWQERRFLATANALVEQGNYRNASLTARRIIQIKPRSAEAYRILGKIAEQVGQPVALDSYRQAVEFGGGRTEDLLVLARSAARFGDRNAAEAALARVPEQARTSAEYHATAAEVAHLRQEPAKVEAHLAEAARAEPTNKLHQLRVAALRLINPDPAVAERGRRELQELQQAGETRSEATRKLIEDALKRKDFAAATDLARLLNESPDRSFADRLIFVDALQQASDPAFAEVLSQIQNEAVSKPEQMSAVIRWLNSNGRAAEAIAWSKRLPPEASSRQLIPQVLADSFLLARDWRGLIALVEKADWQELNFLRLALLARAYREMGRDLDASTVWNEASKDIGANPSALLMLAETVEKWGWRNEAVELLWAASKRPGRGLEALQTLYDYYRRVGDAQGIYRALSRLEQVKPADSSIRNQLTQLSLLLNMGGDRAPRRAREQFEQEPTNVLYATTYAFSLHVAGETAKALQVMDRLNPRDLQQPDVALYYGIILAAAGQGEKATEFLERGERVRLLPEEKALVERARRAADRS